MRIVEEQQRMTMVMNLGEGLMSIILKQLMSYGYVKVKFIDLQILKATLNENIIR